MASKWANRKSKKAHPGRHGQHSRAWKTKFSCRIWRRERKQKEE